MKSVDDALRASCADLLCRDGTCPMHDIARLFTNQIETSQTYKLFMRNHGDVIEGHDMYTHQVNRYEQPIEFLTMLRGTLVDDRDLNISNVSSIGINPRDIKLISRHIPKDVLNDAWRCQTIHIIVTTSILSASMCYGHSFFSPKKQSANFTPNLISIATESYAPQEVCDEFEQSVNNIMYVVSLSGTFDMTSQLIASAKKNIKPLVVVKLNEDDLLDTSLFETIVISSITYQFHHTKLRNTELPITPPTANSKKMKTRHCSVESVESVDSFSPFSNFSALSPQVLMSTFDEGEKNEKNEEGDLIIGKSIIKKGKPKKFLVNNAQLLFSSIQKAKKLVIHDKNSCFKITYDGLYKELPNFLENSAYKFGDSNIDIISFIIKNQQVSSVDTLELLSHCEDLDVDIEEVFAKLSFKKILWIFGALCHCDDKDILFECSDIAFNLVREIIKLNKEQDMPVLCEKPSSILSVSILNFLKLEEKTDKPIYSHLEDICNEYSLTIDSDTIQKFILNGVIIQ